MAGLAIIHFAVPACATTTSDSFQKVTPADRTYSIGEFLAVGFKKSKEYNVAGLPEATEAWLGFWRPEGQDPRQYELRFYASHEDAVEHGTALAVEVTGEDAVLVKARMTWQEGASDRRVIGATALTAFGVYPRYPDFAIFGNVVMLCEGLDSARSLDTCAAMIAELSSPGGG